jgi:Copper(I)-binding protein CorA
MKLHHQLIGTLVLTMAMASGTQAATKLNGFVSFTPGVSSVFKVQNTSWRDPLFGNMGWAHKSSWGSFSVSTPKIITIEASTTVPGFHPAITVWYRGPADTAPDIYIPDHAYPQNSNFVELGAKDPNTNLVVGDISMQVVRWGYDQDGHTQRPPFMSGLTDRVAGKVRLAFVAQKKGTYQFVVGGFNPNGGISSTKQDVTVTVK